MTQGGDPFTRILASQYQPVFSYKLRSIVGFGLVENAISTNLKPTIYRNLYEKTGAERLGPVSEREMLTRRFSKKSMTDESTRQVQVAKVM